MRKKNTTKNQAEKVGQTVKTTKIRWMTAFWSGT